MQSLSNPVLIDFIQKAIELCTPSDIHLCDGSEEEYNCLTQLLVEKGAFVRLDPNKRPSSFWCHSLASDVARVEEATFICSLKKEDAGPTNNWQDPSVMKTKLQELFSGCMKGRTMYIIPYCMGPLGSSLSHIGVQITDSPYVVCNMKLMTRMGKGVLDTLGTGFFVPCMHSVGAPLADGMPDSYWPCNPDHKYIVHFPEEKSIWSYGSGYGGNALLGKKSFALRIASVMAKEEMWLAEHMLILGITSPKGEKKYFVAAFPSQCGKTNLALLSPTLPGWKIECIGDDIAWMRWKEDGRLHAINPEAGFFGVAPGTSYEKNPNAMRTIEQNTIFTNVALTAEKDVWWEGMSKDKPDLLTSWEGKPWTPESKTPAAHPNARFTVSAGQCPVIDPLWNDPEGVPISAIIFGGRRSNTIPLVSQSFDWDHGVFYGASLSSETTAAISGAIGKLRHDPFAMLPFCGYNMGDYFAHWIEMGRQKNAKELPLFFYVSWFLQGENKEWLWPGFGENIRVLKWMFERCDGVDNAITTPIGYLPSPGSLDITGLNITPAAEQKLLHVEMEKWKEEVKSLETYFSIFGDKFPSALKKQLDALKQRLSQCVS
ncbi:MAG: phosphoenolpyruvate carboxykinase (GTP) [Chlamydiae bacterium]|nr:phosphoenolpyruvate carboxykinase (GTP) [Chlamydiota bacterium]